MAKHLHHITRKVRGYLAQGSSQSLHKSRKTLASGQKAVLPDALKLAILRGEARMRIQTFDFFSSRGFDDAFALHAYRKIYTDSNTIIEFAQKIGLLTATEDYISSGVAQQAQDYRQHCYQLHCLLVDHLHQSGEAGLCQLVTVGLMQHYLPGFFPKQANARPSLEQLKKQLQVELNRHYHTPVTVKESFVTAQDSVDFRLIAHMPGCYPLELIRLEEKRVRSARFTARHQLLALLQAGELTAQPQRKPAKK